MNIDVYQFKMQDFTRENLEINHNKRTHRDKTNYTLQLNTTELRV